jgi:hypothetical protein
MSLQANLAGFSRLAFSKRRFSESCHKTAFTTATKLRTLVSRGSIASATESSIPEGDRQLKKKPKEAHDRSFVVRLPDEQKT